MGSSEFASATPRNRLRLLAMTFSRIIFCKLFFECNIKDMIIFKKEGGTRNGFRKRTARC